MLKKKSGRAAFIALDYSFWNDPERWPHDPPGYVFLARAFHGKLAPQPTATDGLNHPALTDQKNRKIHPTTAMRKFGTNMNKNLIDINKHMRKLTQIVKTCGPMWRNDF